VRARYGYRSTIALLLTALSILRWIVVYLLVLFIGVVLAYAIAAISPNMDVANALLPVWVTIQLLWAGFVSSTSAMPVWWKVRQLHALRLRCGVR
jgi:hypothetical protein